MREPPDEEDGTAVLTRADAASDRVKKTTRIIQRHRASRFNIQSFESSPMCIMAVVFV